MTDQVIERESYARQRRLTGVLFGGVALGSTAHIAAVTISTLAIDELTGSANLAGVPGAAAVVGTALGTTLLTVGIARRGRRPGLVLGYASAALGALLCIVAVAASSVIGLIGGMALLGLGNASGHLSRYAAADMYPASRRGAALGMVVWAGTVGSVAGPALLQPSGRFAISLGRSELVGAYMVAFVFLALAGVLYLVALRPDPTSLASEAPNKRRVAWSALATAFRLPQVRVALSAMVAGQVVMVMIMTATPLHIRHHGSDLGIVGLVMSAHTLGMFALSPITGRLADRFGGRSIALAGMSLLGISAIGAAIGPIDSTAALVGLLWALGVGWNMTFVSGSSMLSAGVESDVRARLQGSVDSVTWISGAVAAIGSGVLYQASDYRVLGLIGLGLLAAPVVIVLRNRNLAAVARG
jgi:MFS family permease